VDEGPSRHERRQLDRHPGAHQRDARAAGEEIARLALADRTAADDERAAAAEVEERGVVVGQR
jgi:hypothetical protein